MSCGAFPQDRVMSAAVWDELHATHGEKTIHDLFPYRPRTIIRVQCPCGRSHVRFESEERERERAARGNEAM